MRLALALSVLLALPGCELCWYRGQAPGECAFDDDDATGDDDDIAPDDDDTAPDDDDSVVDDDDTVSDDDDTISDDDDTVFDDDDTVFDDDDTAPDDDDTAPDLCATAPSTLTVGAVTVPLVCLPPGSFFMGSPGTEPGRGFDEERHRVVLTRHVLMTAHEIIQPLYLEVIGGDVSDCTYGCGPLRPVQNLNWSQTLEFCNALSDDVGLAPAYTAIELDDAVLDLDAPGWRLPTEAEWEYAARAGAEQLYAGSDTLGDVGWCNGADDPYEGTDVGSLAPNAWRLYDMSGNVSEWVWDRYGSYPTSEVTDPTGASFGSERVARGGTYAQQPADCRVANRTSSLLFSSYWNRGFRIVRTLP